jgi:hypothetical protein
VCFRWGTDFVEKIDLVVIKGIDFTESYVPEVVTKGILLESQLDTQNFPNLDTMMGYLLQLSSSTMLSSELASIALAAQTVGNCPRMDTVVRESADSRSM